MAETNERLAQVKYFKRSVAIAEELRARIISGHLAPGDQMPTRAELTEAYGVSSVTVQRAIDQLRADGFIESTGRRGTYVSAMPPHLSRYALLFPTPFRNDQPDNLFYRALIESAHHFQERYGIEFCICSGFEGRVGFDAYDTLLDDIQNHRVAGLIFASSPFALRTSPLLDPLRVPCVVFGSDAKLGISAISVDSRTSLKRMVETLAQAGCQRPAAIFNPGQAQIVDSFRALCEAAGMEFHPELVQAMHLSAASWARRLPQLMFALPRNKRPDGLLIGDDNLAEPVTQGLVDLGLRVPEDLQVTVQCNFPLETPAACPITRIGFDMEDGIRRSIRIIDLLRAGKKAPQLTELAALSEDEWREQRPAIIGEPGVELKL